jgi:hypothetical protein
LPRWSASSSAQFWKERNSQRECYEHLAGYASRRVDHIWNAILAHLFVRQVRGPRNDAAGIALRPACGAFRHHLPRTAHPRWQLDFRFTNIRLLAGIIAIITAWVSRNTLLTILVGMAALLILGWM